MIARASLRDGSIFQANLVRIHEADCVPARTMKSPSYWHASNHGVFNNNASPSVSQPSTLCPLKTLPKCSKCRKKCHLASTKFINQFLHSKFPPRSPSFQSRLGRRRFGALSAANHSEGHRAPSRRTLVNRSIPRDRLTRCRLFCVSCLARWGH